MNVLISCAGKQASLVSFFQEALQGTGKIIATDINPHAGAFCSADKALISPTINDASYLPWMLEICKKEHIGLLFSLLEDDTIILEAIRKELKSLGCFLLGAPPKVLALTQNKFLMQEFFEGSGIQTPPTWMLQKKLSKLNLPEGPLVLKHKRGRGSIGMLHLKSVDDLYEVIDSIAVSEDWVLQPFLSGREYGVDVINDLTGRFQVSFQREKIAMLNGETDIATTVFDEGLALIAKTLGNITQHQGCMDADLIITKEGAYLIDLNIRFGGGYAFSHVAGGNLPAALLAWAGGRPVKKEWLKPELGVTSARTSRVLPLPKNILANNLERV